jgi:uncharacterized protein (DUF427 family)
MASRDPKALRVERSPKRVRVLFGGEMLADSTDVRLVWERPTYPTYYFPQTDVLTELLEDAGEVAQSLGGGDARVMTVTVGLRQAPHAALWYADAAGSELEGLIRFDWRAMDAWFEEDEEVYVHPRDPYKRVDVLQSSRHVRVEVDGVTVADSRMPRVLFETGLPRRFYLPKTDVRMGLLTPTATRTHCPYKGTAQYYAVRTDGAMRDDLAWWYQHPIPECAAIAGYVCFYDEKVDVHVDGILQDRPRTPFA